MLVGSREGNLREGRQHALPPAGHSSMVLCKVTVQAEILIEGLGFFWMGGLHLLSLGAPH